MKIKLGQMYYLEYKNTQCYAEIIAKYQVLPWATYDVKVIKFFGGSKGDITLDGQYNWPPEAIKQVVPEHIAKVLYEN